ncbi:uncharacterized protein EV154DRAFT_493125 [Mucor mucedo]|uniref:uncharacterized protein n=1 Tax=Mucor mucedo TaxID=29922 RepID=UPI00221F091A|nr:uncharacterized protein EV154DRAFT_493125 [Mucor mucedo]KAI7895994.1 hypothetical protein EV154DRAFT_493125 [Mucor mucedo]
MESSSAERNPILKDVGQQVIYYGGDDGLHETEEETVQLNVYKRSLGERYFFKYIKKMHLFFLLVISLTVMVYMSFATPLPLSFNYDKINTIISFGDSYTTRYLDMKSLSYACRNCTSAGGPNWVIYLTDTTNWISWDFAYNSAPINNNIVNQAPTVIDVSTQVRDLYPKIFVSPTEEISDIVASKYKDMMRTPESTLTTIWVGINDIDLTYDYADTDALDSKIMQAYQVLIDELINEGVHQFMLINVPPIDRAPMWHNTRNENLIRSRVRGYNEKLKIMIEGLKKGHPKDTFFEYDAWSYFNMLMDNPKPYNMTDIDTFCPDWAHPEENNCKPIEEYFWLNDLHPTFHVHELLAKDIQRYLRSQ